MAIGRHGHRVVEALGPQPLEISITRISF